MPEDNLPNKANIVSEYVQVETGAKVKFNDNVKIF